MPAPAVTVTLEPTVGGSLVYLPMAPLNPNGPGRGRILIELLLQNKSAKNVTATSVSVSFLGSTVAGGSRAINLTVKPTETGLWEMASGADHFLFDQAKAPTTAVVSVFFAGYADPVTVTAPVTAHINPTPGGAYHFPSLASDLKLGEFWQLNGCSHNPGNHQMFAYDMAVWGTNHDGTGYSPLTTGGDPSATKAPNEEYRSFGKPVRAMADGEVLAIVNDCPDNPVPAVRGHPGGAGHPAGDSAEFLLVRFPTGRGRQPPVRATRRRDHALRTSAEGQHPRFPGGPHTGDQQRVPGSGVEGDLRAIPRAFRQFREFDRAASAHPRRPGSVLLRRRADRSGWPCLDHRQ